MSDDNDQNVSVDLSNEVVTGDDLRSRCRQPGGALQFTGGRIPDSVDLSDMTLDRRVSFVDTVFEQSIGLSSARCRSLDFTRCRLLGGMDATAARIDGNLTLSECEVTVAANRSGSQRPATIWLTDAKVTGRIDITSTTIGTADDNWTRSIHADRVEVAAGVSLVDDVKANGEIKLTGATIGGSVQIYGTQIHDPYVALYISEARIGGNLSIMVGRGGVPSTIDGGLVASGCVVNGQFLVYASSIKAPTGADNPRYRFRGARSGVAIDATRARFDGDVRIYGGTTVQGKVDLATATVESQLDLADTIVEEPDTGWLPDSYSIDLSNTTLGSDLRFHGSAGSIRLENAKVAGSVHFEDVEIEANRPESIEARNARIEGDVWLDRARSIGGDVDFRLSHVAGDWRAPGAYFDSTGALEDSALTLTSIEVDGSVFLSRSFEAVGLIRLNRARIGGRLAMDGTTIRQAEHAPSPLVVACRSASVASGLFLNWQVDGEVDFQGTSTNLLVDDPTRWGTGHIISGLTYQRMTKSAATLPSGSSEGERSQRLQWLADQNEADAGTYSQLADYYRRHGRTIDAEEVLIARNRFLRAERRSQGGWRNRLKNLADLLWDVGVGYGYRASRAALLIVALLAATGAILNSGFARDRLVASDEDNVVFSADAPCQSGTVRCFSPAFYAVDTVIPLVDLQQRSTWYPSRNLRYGTELEWGLNLTVLLGWVASSALVLGLTRTLSPES